MNISKLRPTGDKIILRRCEADEVTPGGIFIPDTARERPVEAIVVAVGRGKFTRSGTFVETTVKVGDKVIVPKWGGNEVKIDGEMFDIVTENDILCVFDPDSLDIVNDSH